MGTALRGAGNADTAEENDERVSAPPRRGPHGVHAWSELIEAGVARREPRLAPARRFAPGQPILVTRNDRLHGLVNGDTGLVVPGDRGEPEVAFADGRRFLPAQVSATEPWWAMTIHKSQGSEYRHVVVSLPDAGSPMLTRELLYTAITRAVEQVTVLGSPEAITEAVGRPIARASGLAERL